MSNMTFTPAPQSLNGSWEVFGAANSQISFTVAPSVNRIVLFRPIDAISDEIKLQLSGNSCTPRTVAISTYVIAAFMPNQPYTINLGGCTNVVISRNNALPTAIGIDRIQLLGAEQPLGVGTYHPRNLYEYFTGRNGEFLIARADEGIAQRLLSTVGDSFALTVASDVKYVTLYRDNYSFRDPIRVRTQQCSNPAHAQDYNVTGNGPNNGAFVPFVVAMRTCSRVLFTRVPVQAAPAIDRVVLSSEVASGALSIGMYDNLNLSSYFTNAVITPDATTYNGSWHVLPNSASLSFTVAPTVQRMTVFRPINNLRDDLKVDLSGACTPVTRVLDSFVIAAYMPDQPYTIDLNGCTTVTISKNNTVGRSDIIGIDRIQLHGAVAALPAGEYHTTDLYEYFQGRNGEFDNARANGGIAQRILSTIGDAFAFNVTPDVKTVVLYRDNFSTRDPIRVRTQQCSTPTDAKDYNVVNNGPNSGGFEPTVVTMLSCTRILFTRVPVQAAPAIDRLVLLQDLPATLPIGEYDNLELASRFTGSTALGNTDASDGSWHRFDSAASALTLTVDVSVKRIVVFRQLDNVRDDLTVTLSGGGSCIPGIVTVDSFVIAAFMWNQPYVVNLANCTNVVIRRANVVNATATGVDRIELLGAETPLGLGTYHTKDLYEYFSGRNALVIDSRAEDGVGQRLLDTTNQSFRFDVAPGVSRVVLYRQNFATRDPLRVRTSIGGSCVPQDYNVTNDGTDADFGFPIVIDLNGCTNIRFDRVPIQAAPILERIVLLPAPAPTLTSGNLYEEFAPGLVFTGAGWTPSFLSISQSIPSRRLLFSSTLNAAVTFTVTGNGFIVYHRVAPGGSNNVEVCVTTGANTTCTNYSIQSATVIASFPVGIYGLGNGTHTVTITNKQSGGNLFIDAIRIP